MAVPPPGRTHHDLGDLERAKEYHERALAIYLKRLGPDHANVANCYHHLGCIQRDLGDLERAKEYHENQVFQHSDVTTDSGKLCSMCNII